MARRATAALAVFVVAIYVCAILVLTGPTNPLSIRSQGAVGAVMRPHLDQNWRLFAPDPISDERGILVRAWLSGEDGPTEWLDVTSSAQAESRAFGPFSGRRSRIVSTGLQMYFQPTPLQTLAIDQAKRRGEPVPEQEEELSPEESRYRQRALDLLHRFALLEVDRRWPGQVESVQIRVVIHKFPPFSQRAEWDQLGDVRVLDLPRRNAGSV